MVETPVLFITFARPEYARQTWEGIKASQPKKLYFYSNKGRVEKEGEIERNEEIRAYINEIDWECELHTFFRKECVNVYDSIQGAINWLFHNEELGIILEEDCVPTKAFFSFVDQLIEKYRDIEKVWYISGDNFYDINPSGYDYIFSRYHWMYGWATWRDRWEKIKWSDFEVQNLLNSKLYYKLFKSKRQCENRKVQILKTKDMTLRNNCWDYGFGYTVDNSLGVGVFPTKHLIHNIGFSGEHHKKATTSFANKIPTYDQDVYIIEKEPPIVDADYEFDYQYFKIRRKARSLRERISELVRYYIKHRR